MIYSREFFDLQLRFARRAAALTGSAIEETLLEYTNLYIRFGFGRDFNPVHPSWQAYLRGLSQTDDPQEWTYRFYLERVHAAISHPVVATFGCFAYARFGEDSIKLHFHNAEPHGAAPTPRDPDLARTDESHRIRAIPQQPRGYAVILRRRGAVPKQSASVPYLIVRER